MSDMAQASQAFWWGMAAHLWQSTLILGLLYLVVRLLHRAPARFVAAIWWLGLIKLFLPLQVLGRLSDRVLEGFAADLPAAGGVSVVAVWFYPDVLRITADGSAGSAHPGFALLTLVWALGAVAILGLAWLRARAAGIRSPRAARGAPCAKLGSALEWTTIPRDSVRRVADSRMPAVHGLLRPRILVPQRLVEALNVDELRAVLLHEDAHRRRRDPLRFVFLAGAAAVFFFYPPVWWLLRRIRESTELACDEAALRAGASPALYARSLARTLKLGLLPGSASAAISGSRPSSLRTRFDRLSETGRYVAMARHRWIVAAAVTLVVAGSLAPFAPLPAEASLADPLPKEFAELQRLDGADRMVQLDLEPAPVEKVLQALATSGRFELEVQGELPAHPVVLRVWDVTLTEALVRIGRQVGLVYEVPAGSRLRVRALATHLAGKDGVTKPIVLQETKVMPVYPKELRRDGVSGRVTLQAIIDEAGWVTDLTALHVDPPGQDELVRSAIEAVEQWRYEPATLDGVPVRVYFTVVVEFKLE